jgi:integrase/recombinase XerC
MDDTQSRQHNGRFAKPGEFVSLEALHAAKQAELAERNAAPKEGTDMHALHPFFVNYVAHLERKGRDPKTVKRNATGLRRLSTWLANVGVEPAKATEVMLEEYVAHLTTFLARTTANTEATYVKSAYRYAVRLGLIVKSPAENLEAPSVPVTDPEVFSNEELRKIRGEIGDDLDEAIFYGLAYTGLRRAELVGLTWDDVDFANAVMSITGKGSKPRKVPMHPLVVEVFANIKRRNGGTSVLGKGGSLRNVNQRIENLLTRAGIDGGNRPAHRFRKTVSTVLFEEGVQGELIDKLLGWSPLNIRQRYYTRVADQALYDAVLKLYVSNPIESAPVIELHDARELRKAV